MGDEITEFNSDKSLTYTEVFDEIFPMFLAIGMSYDEFFRDDPLIVKYYISAENHKRERKNYDAWLQGKYIDEALAVNMYNVFKPKGKKAIKYSDRPYQARKQESEIHKHIEKKKQSKQAEAWMNNFVNLYKNR